MRIRVSEDVVSRDLAGEAVLLDLATGTYFGLDEVGTRVWHLLREHGAVDGVVRALLREYDVEESRLRTDLDVLVADLQARGLVKIDAP
jgi:hypothetical protein